MLPEDLKPRWNLVGPLGEGGQGTTHRLDSLSDPLQLGVLKRLQQETNEQARERMAIEAINLHKLNRQGVKVPKVLEENTSHYRDQSIPLYLVMRLISGQL